VATRLYAIHWEFVADVGIQEYFIVKGTMNVTVTVSTSIVGGYTVMHDHVLRRYTVALEAETVIRLPQKAIVGGAVRLMTLDAATAVDQVRVYYRMLVEEGPGLLRVAGLTFPVMPGSVERILNAPDVVAIGTADVIGNERVRRALLEFGLDRAMAGTAEVLSVVLNQVRSFVVVNRVAARAGYTGPTMRIGGSHRHLMWGLMTLSAGLHNVDQFQLRRFGYVLWGRVLYMLLPAAVTAYAADGEPRSNVVLGSELMRRPFEALLLIIVTVKTNLRFADQLLIGVITRRHRCGKDVE
jgi:hypothetical protein